MKRLLLFIVSSFWALSSMAQIEHMRFMGIPLDGKISVFQKELKKKGFEKNELTKYLSPKMLSGTRIYKGIFADEIVDLIVYFDKDTKIVNRARVIIDCFSIEQVNEKFDKFVYNLKEKYDNSFIDDNLKDSMDKFGIGVPNSNRTRFVGYIFLEKDFVSFKDKYSVMLEYFDYGNYENTKDNVLEDL